MNSVRLTGLAAAGAAMLLAAAPASAHHAIGAIVDTSKELQTDMVLTKIDWINPHAWFHFSVRAGNGAVVRDVMIEWVSLSGLKQSGYAGAGDFDVGGTYKVTYNPNRDGSPGGHLVKMIAPDGEVVQRH